jgi:glutaredoxin 3
MLGESAFKRFSNAVFQGETMPQPKVEIYTKMYCGYCWRAKRLLEGKGVEFTEYDITLGGPRRDEMRERAPGARTVPQIFIDDRPVGGSDDLAALERAGKLDELLGL